jgi:2'-5' RNA ligase
MYFVLARFHDPAIEELLTRLYRLFNNREPASGIHVTLRGPYKSRPTVQQLEKIEREVNLEPLRLNGIEVFQGKHPTVVLLVINDRLKRVWWKPDFPIEKFGFYPHVTMAERSPVAFARRVESALKAARIDQSTSLAGISLHQSGSPQLFTDRIPRERPIVLPAQLQAAYARAFTEFTSEKWQDAMGQQQLPV